MKPISFPQQNAVIAKDQPEYIPLPAHVDAGRNGTVTSCWAFTWRERIRILFGAPVYWRQLTFRSPLQPIRPSLDFPDERDK
jgi:hypothetical protein